MERLLFLAKIERGILQADAGDSLPHEHVRERINEWLREDGLIKRPMI